MRKIVIEVPDDDCSECDLLHYSTGWVCLFRNREKGEVTLFKGHPTAACRDAEVSQ